MSDPRVKKEGGASSSTTIGGAQKVQFAPRIPVRRKTTDGSVAAATSELRDLITTKVEKKMAPRANTRAAPVATAARVAFQPSGGPGQGQSMSSGEELRDVAMIVTHQTGARIPGQHVEPEGDVKAKRLGVKKEGDASLVGEGELSAEELAELSAEAELNEMLARENAYDQFLDNGDARQYRPVLLPFPVVRLGTQGSSSAARSASASPVEVSRPNSFGAATNMFDIDEAEQSPPAAAVVPPIRTAASDASAPYKALPLNTPARLLGQIDHEEKLNGGAVPSARNILFFQFPSHLPFKQAASWAPPVNPLLALNGAHRQGAGATVFGDAARGPQAAASSAASSAAQNVAASPSLQALHALSSPALPPLQASLGMPNLSLGAPSSGVGSKVGGVPSSGLMDDVGTSSALATEEEQDLGEVSKNDPNKVREQEKNWKQQTRRLACAMQSRLPVPLSSHSSLPLCLSLSTAF